MSIFKKLKTKYKSGDEVTLNREITFGNGVSIPAGAKLTITFADPLFRVYDAVYKGIEYTDFSDKDFS